MPGWPRAWHRREKRKARRARQFFIGRFVAAASISSRPRRCDPAPRRKGAADAQAGLLDMRQRAPVEILAADVRFPAVDDEILGVQHAAGQLFPVEQPASGCSAGRGSGRGSPGRCPPCPASQRMRTFTPRRPAASTAWITAFQRLPFFARQVEFGEVQRAPGAVDHFQPDRGGVARAGAGNGRLQRHRGDDLDRGSGGGKRRRRQEKRRAAGRKAAPAYSIF